MESMYHFLNSCNLAVKVKHVQLLKYFLVLGTSSSTYVPNFVSQYSPREIFSEFGFDTWDEI